MDELLSIGDFAARSGLSRRMLRGYAAAGVLVPAAVDRWSGYRYYAPGQLRIARAIGALRRAGIPLADIAPFLADPSTAWLDRRERRLAAELLDRTRALREAGRQLALDQHAGSATPIDEDHPMIIFTAGSSPAPTRKDTTMVTITAAAATDIGRVRDADQDAVLIDDRLFAVADGFGPDGAAASRLALDALHTAVAADPSAAGFVAACREANAAVWRRGSPEVDAPASGNTLAAIAHVGDAGGPIAATIGDSRVYRYHNGELRRYGRDHSAVAELVGAGALTEQQARDHPQRALLTRALGCAPTVEVDTAVVPATDGDRLLLCTDGLHGELPDARMAALLGSAGTPRAAADALVAAALAEGGRDNVAVIVADVRGG